MKLGYVHSGDATQKVAKEVHGINRWFIEQKSGKSDAWDEITAFASKGDCIVVESLADIASGSREVMDVLTELNQRGIFFRSAAEQINTETAEGKRLISAFAAMQELDRQSSRRRRAEGIEKAKKEGKYAGRKRLHVDEKKFDEVVARWRKGEITAVTAMKELKLKPNTFYRRVKEKTEEGKPGAVARIEEKAGELAQKVKDSKFVKQVKDGTLAEQVKDSKLVKQVKDSKLAEQVKQRVEDRKNRGADSLDAKVAALKKKNKEQEEKKK